MTAITEFNFNHVEAPLLPYHILRSLVSTRWSQIVPSICCQLEMKEEKNCKDVLTSCIHTSLVVAAIYLGLDRAKSIKEIMTSPCLSNILVQIGNQKIKYMIYDLFAGRVLNKINKGVPLKAARRKIPQMAEVFTQELKALLPGVNARIAAGEISNKQGIELFEGALLKTEYQFNRSIIEKLKKTVIVNAGKVSNQCSFLFSIALRYDTFFEHAFVWELYFSPQAKAPRLRQVQSWVGQADVSKDMESCQYGEQDEGTLTLDGFIAFSDQLHLHCENPQYRQAGQINCFGYVQSSLPLVYLKTVANQRVFGGLNVRYICHAFNPAECAHKLVF